MKMLKNPEDVFDTDEQLKVELRKIMTVLDDREMTIIGDYFGLTGTPRTLSDIGDDFNLTKERVRQIKEKYYVNYVMRVENF